MSGHEKADGVGNLRDRASTWSLAGDRELLATLQHIHENVIKKCSETKERLDELTTSLDVTAVCLRNVNNRFSSLGNSQFVESRVYDDDPTMEVQAAAVEVTPLSIDVDAPGILATLHRFYVEPKPTVEYVTDNSDEDELSVVLKPRDLYEHRPLPDIIGTESWLKQPRAAKPPREVLTNEKDIASEREAPCERDSNRKERASSIDGGSVIREYIQELQSTTVSSNRSSLMSEDISAIENVQAKLPVKPTAAELTAEIARRLGGATTDEGVVNTVEAQATPKIVHAPPIQKGHAPRRNMFDGRLPHTRVIGNVFTDEPPPIEETNDDEPDIFADLTHAHTDQYAGLFDDFAPYSEADRSNSRVGLAKRDSGYDDLFGETKNLVAPAVSKGPSKGLFDSDEDDFFADTVSSKADKGETPASNKTVSVNVDTNSKKPIGGVSLFGSQKTSSIGAAIIKRRKMSTSDEDDFDSNETVTKATADNSNNRDDDFDDLFSNVSIQNLPQSSGNFRIIEDDRENTGKNLTKCLKDSRNDNISNYIVPSVPKNTEDKKVKLGMNTAEDIKPNSEKSIFSDDIFEDNDIFISKPKITTEKSQRSSIFDDDDDLFADDFKQVEKPKNSIPSKLFDDEDDLFSESTSNKASLFDTKRKVDIAVVQENTVNSKMHEDIKEVSKVLVAEQIAESNAEIENHSENDIMTVLSDTRESIEIHKSNAINTCNFVPSNNISEIIPSKISNNNISLFDDDGGTDDLFAVPKGNTESNEIERNVNISPLPQTQLANNNSKILMESSNNNFKNSTENENIAHSVKSVTNNYTNTENKEIDGTITYENVSGSRTKTQTSKNLTDCSVENFKPKLKNYTSSDIIACEIASSKEIEIDNSKTQIVDAPPRNVTDIFYNEFENENKDTLITAESTIKDKSKNELHSAQYNPVDNFFDSVFSDQPPVFEKSKKLTNNVNALFGDDSDDEGEFLKKHDNVSVCSDDSKSLDDFVPPNEDDLFNIANHGVDVRNKEFIRNLSSPVNEDEHIDQEPKKTESNLKDSGFEDLEYRKYIINKDGCKVEEDTSKTIVAQNTRRVIEHLPFDKQESQEIHYKTPDITETDGRNNTPHGKTVGKLKQLNLNINVQSLLPGAAPKIITKTNSDNYVKTVHSENFHNSISDAVDYERIVKSVSFDSNPNTPTLSNTFSKERAKIQVKRRPSTRRARKDAVRNSSIFPEDCKDEVDYTEEKVKVDTDKAKHLNDESENTLINTLGKIYLNDNSDNSINSEEFGIQKNINDKFSKSVNTEATNDKLIVNSLFESDDTGTGDISSNNKKGTYDNTKLSDENLRENNNSLNKVPHSTTNSAKHNEVIHKTEVKRELTRTSIFDDFDDDIENSTNIFHTSKQETKPTHETKVQPSLKSNSELDRSILAVQSKTEKLFDDSDDDILPNTSAYPKSNKPDKISNIVAKQPKLFDDDSDDESLFGAPVKVHELRETRIENIHERKLTDEKLVKTVKRPGTEVKSLFEDDDDDLFGTIKSAAQQPKTPLKPTENTSAEEVFQDPLSFFE